MKTDQVRKTIYMTEGTEAEIMELMERERRSFAVMAEILIIQALKERKRKRKDAKTDSN